MPNSSNQPWLHAPPHWLFEPGIYMVTAATHGKIPLLNNPARLDLVQELLFACARDAGWELQAWAILSNHYHFVAAAPPLERGGPKTLPRLLGKLHMLSAKELNRQDGTPGRRIWAQYWDSHITFQSSYLARLRYVHENAVHHGLVTMATTYRWCSAAWFERHAPNAFVQTVGSMKIDQVCVEDNF